MSISFSVLSRRLFVFFRNNKNGSTHTLKMAEGESQARQLRMGVSFQISFASPILDRLAVVGKYDGRHPALTCATAGGRVMVHTAPTGQEQRDRETSAGDIRSLNIQRTPTALATGQINPKKAGDALMIGSQTAIVAYNVETNSDVFYKDINDGVNCLTFGSMAASDQKLVVVGGNCAILGFDEEGAERFWTVTGDNVSSLALLPWKAAGRNALLVGSDDYEIRVFDNEEVMCSMTETDKISELVPTPTLGRFVYSLANGTVGVYQLQNRLWRFKSKNVATSVSVCDVDFDGVAEAIVGWSNGKLEVRSDGGAKGETIFKETLSSRISAVLHADYRGENRDLPMVCTYDGDVRAYVAMETRMEEAAEAHDQRILEKLMQQRQDLQFQVTSLDHQMEKQRKGEDDSNMPSAQTTVTCKLRPNAQAKSIELVLTATEGAVIRSAIIAAPLLFGANESCFVYAEEPTATLVASFALEKDIATELSISAMVGFNMSDTFQVHDLKFKLPRFAMYIPLKELSSEPNGKVTTRISDRLTRVQAWLQSSFNGGGKEQQGQGVEACFVSLRDRQQIQIVAMPNTSELIIRADSMEVCGDVIQDLGQFLALTELATTVEFPREFEALKEVLNRVEEYNSVRMKLTAEMADSTQLVKALVIKAEDARILNDMKLMKKMYGSLYDLNRELIGEYMKRSNNHNELLSALKAVNIMIQKAANLRIGTAKTTVVSECRNAIRTNQLHSLFNAIRNGKA